MKLKKLFAAVLAASMILSFSACKDSEEENTDGGKTVTGGSVEDVFDLDEDTQQGEDPTIDPGIIDGDSGEVSTNKTSTSQKVTTTRPNFKNETTVSGNVSASNTDKGYKISWSAVSGAKGYNVYRATSKDGTYTFLGTTTDTYYVDKNGSSNYFYKVTVAKPASTTNPVSNNAGFKGATSQFANEEGGQTFISSNLNNKYVAFVRNEYAKKGLNCPPGRLAYVQIPKSDYQYVFQFDNTKKWNGDTLEQVQIFTDKNDSSKYFSFFTKDTGSQAYLDAKKTAVSKWNSAQGSDGSKYDEMQALLVALAKDPHFQQVIDASYQ